MSDLRSLWSVFTIALAFASPLLSRSNTIIYHTPPEQATVGTDLDFEARVNDPSTISRGLIYYRAVGNQSYQEIEMDRAGFDFEGTIPGMNLTSAGIEYVIVLQDKFGSTLAFPMHDPFENPQYLPVKADPKLTVRKSVPFKGIQLEEMESEILILNPASGDVIFTEEVVIAASYFFMDNIDSTTVRIFLDRKDVTASAEIGEGVINYIAIGLKPGLHQVTLRMSTDLGVPVKPFSWSFTVGESRFHVKDYVDYNGNLNSQVSSESVGNTGLNVSEISGKFNTNFKWLSLRSRFRLTTRESQYLQPYNRYSLDLYFGDYLTIRLGDVNPNLSAFLIDGQRIRGLGVTLAFKYFEFKMVRGDVNRAIHSLGEIDRGYFLLNNTSIDSSGNVVYELDRRGYTFRRGLDAYRLSFKWKNKYWAGFQFLKSIDDIESVDKIIGDDEQFTVQEDTLISGIPGGNYTYDQFVDQVNNINGSIRFKDNEWGGNNPVDNLVAGLHLGSAFDEQRLKVEFSWNFSLYNRNIWNGAMTKAEMDTALDDTLDGYIGTQYENDGSIVSGSTLANLDDIPNPTNYENIFTINAFMTPLVPVDALSYKAAPVTTIVNMPSSAFNLKLSGHYYLNNFSIEYRQVGPEFVTLGNPYLTKNIREFIAMNRISLLDRKLSLSMSFNHRDNKILKNPSNPLVTNTFSLGISLLPGPDAPSFTFNIQSIGKDNERKEKFENIGGIRVDKREEYRTINSLVSVNYPFQAGRIKNNFVINYNEIKNTDMLIDDRASGYVFPKMDMKSYSGSLTSQPFGSLRTVLNYSRSESAVLVYFENTPSKVPLVWVSYGLSGQYALLNNKLRLLSALFILNSEGVLDNSIYSLRGGSEYTVFDGLIASLSGNIQMNRQKKEFDLTNSGVILSLRYRF